jgi:similar to spore coat protein
MNHFLQNFMGMGGITDQIIATDYLVSAKSAVRNYAAAITETATPELKEVLREQLTAAIQAHAIITNYMIAKEYYHPHELREQLQVDFTATETAIKLADK